MYEGKEKQEVNPSTLRLEDRKLVQGSFPIRFQVEKFFEGV